MLASGEVLCLDSPRFRAMSEAVLAGGCNIRFQARGLSMQPNIHDGDLVVVAPAAFSELRIGHVVLTEFGGGLKLHRIISIESTKGLITTKGDASCEPDVPVDKVLGRVIEVHRFDRTISFSGQFSVARDSFHRLARRLKLACAVRFEKMLSVPPSAGR